MKYFISTIILLVLLAQYSVQAQQCPPGGAAFVNEFSGSGIEEYIELVVIGDPASPLAPVDLEGWIVDDNNIDQVGQGTASGHLILGSCFNAMAPGSIILIYNPDAPAPGIDPGFPNADGAFVIAHDDPCITICTSNPNTGDPNYLPCGSSGFQTWPLCVGLSTNGDGVQVRNPSADFYHGLYYNTNFEPQGEDGCLDVGTIESSLDCGDWFDVSNYSQLSPTPGLANTVLNEALINAIATGNLDCNNIDASCILFTCPEINTIDFVDEICLDGAFDVTASGLAFMNFPENAETDFGIDFILFNGGTPPADPYSGGTSLGIVPNSGLSGTSPNQSATINTSISTMGTYQICAILDPAATDSDCRPYACKTIQINDKPVASLAGYHLFCPGDCHQIEAIISGGTEPYSVTFKVVVAPINFPFTIPAYDVNNQLTICYDASGFIPNYDAGTNTLHFPTFMTGTASFVIETLVDANGCEPDIIDPNFTTLEFADGPEIFNVAPLEQCDDDNDGMAEFDLIVLEDGLNGGNGLDILWFEDADGNNIITDPGAYISTSGYVYASVDDDLCPSDTIQVELIVTVAPNPGSDADVDICNIDETVLDFVTLLGGESGGIWTDDGSSGVDYSDPYNVDFIGVPSGTYTFTYVFLASDICPEVSAVLTVTVNEPVNPGNDNNIGICIGSSNPVDLVEALGPDFESGGAWNDVDASGVDLNDPLAVDFSALGLGTYIFTYTVSSINACLDQVATISVTIFSEPNAGTDNTIEICNEGDTRVDLEDALGPHDNFGDWTDNDGSGVDLFPPADVDFFNVDPGTYNFTYTIPATADCPEVSAVITVNVLTVLSAGQDSLFNLCRGYSGTLNLFEILIGESDDSGVWSQLSGVPIDLSDPLFVSIENSGSGVDSFLYEISNDCGIDSSFVIIDIQDAGNAGNDYLLQLCIGIDTINLFDSLGIYDEGGNWFDENDSPVTDPETIYFTEIDTLNFQYIIDDSGLCGADTAIATIQLIPDVFAGLDTSVFICEGSEIIADFYDWIPGLFDSTGIWIQISGDPIDLTKADSVDLKDLSIGIDSIIYILNGICNTDTALIVLNIDDAPSAGLDYLQIYCQDFGSINLFDSLVDYNAGGAWFDQLFNPVSNPENLVLDQPGTYQYYYIIPESGSCQADTAIAIIAIEAAPYAGADASIVLCEGSGQLINIFEQLGNDPDLGGLWVDVDGSGVDLANFQAVDFSSLGIGTFNYEYIANPLNIPSACSSDTSVLIVSIVSVPNAGQDNTLTLCEGANLNINLDSLIGPHDNNGYWIDNQTSGISLTDSTNVNFTGVDLGSYTFTYFIEANDACAEAESLVSIEILAAPNAGQDNALILCEGADLNINLDSLIGLHDSNGYWIDNQTSGISLTDSTNVNFTGVDLGIYTFTYFIEANYACAEAESLVNIEILAAPNAGQDNALILCEDADLNINLDSLIGLHDSNGYWIDNQASGISLTDSSNVNFTGVDLGIYTFTYFIEANNACEEAQSIASIEILASPNAGSDMALLFCEGYTESINLFESLDPGISTLGTWEEGSGQFDLSQANQVMLNNLGDGLYLLEYTLSLNAQCGTDTAVLNLIIEASPETGTCDTIYICNGPSQDDVDFLSLLIDNDPGGFFRELTTSGVDISDPATIDFEGILQGRYIFEYYFPASLNCPEVSTRIYVEVMASHDELFEAIICQGESFEIGNNTYDLDNPVGTEFLTNAEGCDSIIQVNLIPKSIEVTSTFDNANCFDIGSITITSLVNGDLPLQLSNNDLGVLEITEFPYMLDNVAPGNYDLSFSDALECSYTDQITIEPFPGFQMDLPEVISIQAGQSYQINPLTDMDPVMIEWYPSNGLSCNDCLNPSASPSSDTEYILTLIDQDGCMLIDTILIRVEQNKEVYIPNVFSPNGDAHNPVFYIQSNASSGTYSMSIFDRWGEMIYHGESIPLNDAAYGWDGRYNEKSLMPGVFVYLIKVRFGDGEESKYSGDILLLR